MKSDVILQSSYWEQMLSKIYESLLSKGIDIVSSLLILIIGFFIIGKIAKAIRLAIIKNSGDETVGDFVEQITRIVLKIMLFLTVASQMGIKTTSFVAALGAAGLAIGMALQGSLSNFAGGILILVFKPFKLGDTIESLGFLGEVVKISILHTKLLTPDYKLVVLPNGQVANSSVVNASHEKRRRAEFVLRVGYDEDIQVVRNIILRVLNSDERVYKDPAPTVFVDVLGEVNIQILTRFWTDNGKHLITTYQTLESIKKAFEQEGVTITPGIQKMEIIQKTQ